MRLFNDLLIIREPQKKISVINKGIGGDFVTGLQNRWSDDVLRHRPDWLSVMIGINDLLSVIRGTSSAVKPEIFAEAYNNILSRTKKQLPNCQILLFEPFYISGDTANTSFRNQVLDFIPEYIGVVQAMSRRYKTRLVKTHMIFAKVLEHYEADTFCLEPVHPNVTGHIMIAEAFYTAITK